MLVETVILNQETTLRQLLLAMDNRLTFEHNMQAVIVTVDPSGAADTPFTVVHKLGKIPTGYIANCSAGFVNDVNRSTWTTTQMELKCSALDAAIVLVIF